MAVDLLRYAELVEEVAFPDVDTYTPADQGEGTYFNIASTTLDVPGDTQIEVPTAFGRAQVDTEPGYYAPGGNIAYPPPLSNIGIPLKGVLGGYAFTAGVAPLPNTHEFWGSNARVLSSWLARIGKDIFEHCFQGCVMESIECSVEDALTNVTFEMNAQKDFSAPEGLQSPVDIKAAMPNQRKVPFHQVMLTIDGVIQKKKARSMTWSVSNGTDTGSGRYLGSRYPGRITANARTTNASTSLDFSDLSAIQKLWGGPSGPTDQGAAEFPMQVDYNGGKDPSVPTGPNLSMSVRFPRCNYASVEQQPSGRDEIDQSVSITGKQGSITLLDATTQVETDIYVILKNYEDMIQPPTP